MTVNNRRRIEGEANKMKESEKLRCVKCKIKDLPYNMRCMIDDQTNLACQTPVVYRNRIYIFYLSEDNKIANELIGKQINCSEISLKNFRRKCMEYRRIKNES